MSDSTIVLTPRVAIQTAPSECHVCGAEVSTSLQLTRPGGEKFTLCKVHAPLGWKAKPPTL